MLSTESMAELSTLCPDNNQMHCYDATKTC